MSEKMGDCHSMNVKIHSLMSKPQKSVTIPDDLLKLVDKMAAQRKTSRSALLLSCIKRGLALEITEDNARAVWYKMSDYRDTLVVDDAYVAEIEPEDVQ